MRVGDILCVGGGAGRQYGSLFRFGYAALMQNEFAGLLFHCSEADGTAWLDRLDDATR
jgi:hypothetical protein